MMIESHQPLSLEGRQTLLQIARESISQGLTQGTPLSVIAGNYPAELQAVRACFITLNQRGSLRGCIGHLEASLPLIEDVAENAYSAAFRDPRFPPLAQHELMDLEIHISVLTPSQPISFTSEADLIGQLRPFVDGLILTDGLHRGTFLPSVWEQLPEPALFLRHLKLKAGLTEDYWSDHIQVYRYETESFA
jgi:uncharacterized protein